MIESDNIVILRGKRHKLKGVVLLPIGYKREDIKPAPITEGFLKMNGFREKDYEFFFGHSEFSGAKLHRISDEWELEVDNSVYRFRGWVKYIHELQNILNICQVKERWRV